MEEQQASASAVIVKQEAIDVPIIKTEKQSSFSTNPIPFIDLSSSSSDSDSSEDENGVSKRSRVSNGENGSNKKQKRLDDALEYILPLGFLDPLPQEEQPAPLPLPLPDPVRHCRAVVQGGSKQFWKAGDYEDSSPVVAGSLSSSSTVGMDHVRVHPKFLHSNATSHKWALGAFAELLDNSLDEVISGATFVNVDMIENKKDGSRMLLIEDNGGGMDPDKMRQCMSLGYSAKSKMANVIGQYGNGFKTSTMRLGADVIVFSRCRGKDGKRSTQSIGMLSYTFLRSTAKEDIVVPMVDYEKVGLEWNKLLRSSPGDWSVNVETIVQWSPYSSEDDLFHQFTTLNDQGTRIIIYNLWEDDQGELELDFDTNREDINLRGVNRDEKKIEMAKQFPNSRHFLTYRHSLRSYVSILYLRRSHFRIVLRGRDVEHHNIVNDLMLTQEITYKPKDSGADGVAKDTNMVAIVTLGFVKDAKSHIDVQGFNVYHKNRLIKPFWRVWNAAGSDGRGVIGVLEANFVEPAHDKQGFERTTVLSRLEQRLMQMQKTYWSTYCHKIGYAPRGSKRQVAEAAAREMSPEYSPHKSSRSTSANKDRNDSQKRMYCKGDNEIGKRTKYNSKSSSSDQAFSAEEDSDSEMPTVRSIRPPISSSYKDSPSQRSLLRELSHSRNLASPNSCNSEVRQNHASNGAGDRVTRSQLKVGSPACNGNGHAPVSDALGLDQLKIENFELKDRLKKMEESLHDLELERDKNRALHALGNRDSDLDTCGENQLKMENQKLKNSLKDMDESFSCERERCKLLQTQLKELEQKNEEMNKEQEALIDIFSEERNRRDGEEENLRKKLKDASNTIQQLLDKVRELEKLKSQNCKVEP